MPQDIVRPVHLLGISGSLRRDSHSTAVVGTLAENLADGVDDLMKEITLLKSIESR